jgi:hypothetical protein
MTHEVDTSIAEDSRLDFPQADPFAQVMNEI